MPAPPGYRELLAACGPNKHHQAIALITALIGDGVNTRKGILDVANRNGLNPRHVAIILNEGAGNNPDAHRWRVDENGIYSCWPDSE